MQENINLLKRLSVKAAAGETVYSRANVSVALALLFVMFMVLAVVQRHIMIIVQFGGFHIWFF